MNASTINELIAGTHSYWATVVVASPDDAARREGDALPTASSKILDTYRYELARRLIRWHSKSRIHDIEFACTDVTAFNWLQYRRSA